MPDELNVISRRNFFTFNITFPSLFFFSIIYTKTLDVFTIFKFNKFMCESLGPFKMLKKGVKIFTCRLVCIG